MTPTSGAERFSAVLDGLARGEGERLSLRELVEAFGERAFGAVLLIVSLINLLPLPPGGTTATGAPLLLIAAQLAIGRDGLWLPSRLTDATLSRAGFAKGVTRIGPALRTAERLTKPRLPVLVTDLSERLIGLAVLILALVLILPIPFGNMAPALTCALFSLALMQRDGLAALAGWAMSAVTVGILVAVWKTVERALVHVMEWF